MSNHSAFATLSARASLAALLAAPRRAFAPGGGWPWRLAAALFAAPVALAIGALVLLAMQPAAGVWPHLIMAVMPRALGDTVMLLALVLFLAIPLGVAPAWAVSAYRFPLRRLADLLLVLPLAVPAYITAYAYVDALGYTGPLQSTLRAVFGWRSFRDYWFPDVRSLPGAAAVLALALYPYVYIAARTAFSARPAAMAEVARTLGADRAAEFRRIVLPMAWPAIAAGAALVLMESMADIGAVTFLGVRTLTAAIYSTWLDRSSLAGAAQLSLVLLVFVFGAVMLERAARARMRSFIGGRAGVAPLRLIPGGRGWMLLALVLLPPALGFGIPLAVLLADTLAHADVIVTPGFRAAAINSLGLAGLTAALATAGALAIVSAGSAARGSRGTARRLALLGYAVPGTVIALGLTLPLAAADRALGGILLDAFGWRPALYVSGGVGALLLAYHARFLAVSVASAEAGMGRLSPNLAAAARTLGAAPGRMMLRVHLPLLGPALAAGALMVFVDALKELPATLLMRPFNFETLATTVFASASLENFEAAAPAALAIVLAGLVPLIVLQRSLAPDER